MEQLKPKAVASFMKAGEGTRFLRMRRNMLHQGRRTISLLASIPATALSATNSGSRIGMILL